MINLRLTTTINLKGGCMSPKEILGIDISKNDISVALLRETKSEKHRFANNKSGFNKLQAWLKNNGVNKVKACMEATGCYGIMLADFLYESEHEVYIINPLSIKSFAKSRLSRNKTDEADAIIIAEYIARMPARPYKPDSKEHKQLKFLCRCLEDLKLQKTQIHNHLEDKIHFPKSVVNTWQEIYKCVKKQIKEIEIHIESLIKSNSDVNLHYKNLQTIPGISKTTTAVILAEVPDISEFCNARRLAAFAGLTPKQRQSGSSVKGKTKLSKIGSIKLRKALFFPAIVSKTYNPIIKQFCLKLKKNEKHNMVIIGAAMRKLIHIIFGVLKHKVSFNPKIITNLNN